MSKDIPSPIIDRAVSDCGPYARSVLMVINGVRVWAVTGYVVARDDLLLSGDVIHDREEAKDHAEWVTSKKWDNLEEIGWRIVPVRCHAARVDA